MDDLKAYAQTICEPNISLAGHILEEFEIEGTVYRACMFRTARGNVKATIDMNPMFFICVGELLGTIHAVSTDERALGMNYKRDTMKSIMLASRERCKDKLDKNILDHIDRIIAQVDELPEDLGKYGICHGDFHANNFFVEGNNVWLFDFDGCCYANYLYDVASFVQSCFLMGINRARTERSCCTKISSPISVSDTIWKKRRTTIIGTISKSSSHTGPRSPLWPFQK